MTEQQSAGAAMAVAREGQAKQEKLTTEFDNRVTKTETDLRDWIESGQCTDELLLEYWNGAGTNGASKRAITVSAATAYHAKSLEELTEVAKATVLRKIGTSTSTYPLVPELLAKFDDLPKKADEHREAALDNGLEPGPLTERLVLAGTKRDALKLIAMTWVASSGNDSTKESFDRRLSMAVLMATRSFDHINSRRLYKK